MNGLTIKQKLIGLLTVFIVSFAGIGIYFYQIDRSNDQQVNKIVTNKEIQRVLNHLQYRLTGISNDERGFLLTGDRTFEKETEQKRADIQKDLSLIGKLSNEPGTEAQLSEIHNTLQTYFQLKDKMFAAPTLAESAKIHFNEERNLRKQTVDPAVNQLITKIDSTVKKQTVDYKSMNTMSQWLFGVVFFALVIMTTIFGILSVRSIVVPLKKIQKQLDLISKGEGDLTKEISITTKDELGDLAASFNLFLRSLRKLINQVRNSSVQVKHTSETLQAASHDVIEATKIMNNNIKEVAASAENQSEMTHQSTDAVEEMVIGITQINDNASNVSDLANHATSKAETGSTDLKELVRQIDSIHEFIEQSLESILNLENKSTEIGDILKIIQSISDQTNLLALNAAIEAARAGEAGKGFAVVANEVRKLAEQSSDATKNISQIINSVQRETQQTVSIFNQVKGKVDSGRDFAQSTQAKFHEIIHSFEEISSKIQEISGTTEELSASSEEVSASVNEINIISRQLKEIVKKISKYSDVHLKNIDTVQQDATQLSNMSADLNTAVGKFII
jgi:methyl-accepting chemotaxis protein